LDLIDVFGYGISDFGALDISDTAGGVEIDFGATALSPVNMVTLEGITVAQLGAGDFLFA
jgi:hypothetical protein